MTSGTAQQRRRISCALSPWPGAGLLVVGAFHAVGILRAVGALRAPVFGGRRRDERAVALLEEQVAEPQREGPRPDQGAHWVQATPRWVPALLLARARPVLE
ncbi:unnamed protein product [Prorocentrum cordatum]|uniref:Uncharacterized protein n=1 Tax=Prorocentrum cordatum TaxID=2364126 RepID=A0ABN9XIW2_9DINO|nr:unnamed protein product [Polarella glacialis]